MERTTSVIQHKPKTPVRDGGSLEVRPDIKDDPRWELVQRIIAAPNFARSPLLSRFLLYVAAETLEGRGDEISEHQIGVQVFDRPADYRTLEDNIVRNYARQLRKRLAEYFASEGSAEEWRLDVPLGGYVPVFARATDADAPSAPNHPDHLPITVKIRTQNQVSPYISSESAALEPARPKWQRKLLVGAAVAAYTAALVALTWIVAARIQARRQVPEPAHILWATLFDGPSTSYIVPSDAGFNLLEDLSHHPMPLTDYVQGNYHQEPLSGVDAHSAEDLRSQRLTPFVDSQIVAALAHLPEADPERVSIRFPRDLRLDDLKNSNAVILGSVSSNPWAAIAEISANFRIVDTPGMQGAEILNTKPLPGESPSYASHWNEPAHETFALIALLPNLSGTGHLLLLQGLDVAGTQAAAEMLLHPSAITPILKRATRPDGTLRNFEVLLRATSIESSATGTQVIASRIY